MLKVTETYYVTLFCIIYLSTTKLVADVKEAQAGKKA